MSVAVIACGAIATHISKITDAEKLDVTIYPLPPLLHNQPAKIAGEVEKTYLEIKDKHSKCAVAYADCGTYGALDNIIEKLGLKRWVAIIAMTSLLEKRKFKQLWMPTQAHIF